MRCDLCSCRSAPELFALWLCLGRCWVIRSGFDFSILGQQKGGGEGGSCLFCDTAGIRGRVSTAVKQVLDKEQTVPTLPPKSTASFSSEVDLQGILGIHGTLRHLG